jgi:uncharacterized protein (DUF697 family)
VEAKGGLDLLRSVRTVKVTASTTAAIGANPVPFQTLTWIRYPASYRIDAETPEGRVTQVFDRGEYWVQTKAQGVEQMPAAIADRMRDNIQRDVIPLLVALADGKVTAKLMPDLSEAGRSQRVLLVALPSAPPLTMVFDAETMLIAKMAYEGPAGAQVEEVFSDYRDVRGLKVAFKAVTRGAGAPTIERTLTSFDFNTVIDPALFIRPS